MTKLEKNLDNLADAVYEVLEELGISEYILCAHSWSGILACKLLEKPIKRQTLVAIEPTTKKKSCLLIFQKILIQKWKSR